MWGGCPERRATSAAAMTAASAIATAVSTSSPAERAVVSARPGTSGGEYACSTSSAPGSLSRACPRGNWRSVRIRKLRYSRWPRSDLSESMVSWICPAKARGDLSGDGPGSYLA